MRQDQCELEAIKTRDDLERESRQWNARLDQLEFLLEKLAEKLTAQIEQLTICIQELTEKVQRLTQQPAINALKFRLVMQPGAKPGVNLNRVQLPGKHPMSRKYGESKHTAPSRDSINIFSYQGVNSNFYREENIQLEIKIPPNISSVIWRTGFHRVGDTVFGMESARTPRLMVVGLFRAGREILKIIRDGRAANKTLKKISNNSRNKKLTCKEFNDQLNNSPISDVFIPAEIKEDLRKQEFLDNCYRVQDYLFIGDISLRLFISYIPENNKVFYYAVDLARGLSVAYYQRLLKEATQNIATLPAAPLLLDSSSTWKEKTIKLAKSIDLTTGLQLTHSFVQLFSHVFSETKDADSRKKRSIYIANIFSLVEFGVWLKVTIQNRATVSGLSISHFISDSLSFVVRAIDAGIDLYGNHYGDVTPGIIAAREFSNFFYNSQYFHWYQNTRVIAHIFSVSPMILLSLQTMGSFLPEVVINHEIAAWAGKKIIWVGGKIAAAGPAIQVAFVAGSVVLIVAATQDAYHKYKKLQADKLELDKFQATLKEARDARFKENYVEAKKLLSALPPEDLSLSDYDHLDLHLSYWELKRQLYHSSSSFKGGIKSFSEKLELLEEKDNRYYYLKARYELFLKDNVQESRKAIDKALAIKSDDQSQLTKAWVDYYDLRGRMLKIEICFQIANAAINIAEWGSNKIGPSVRRHIDYVIYFLREFSAEYFSINKIEDRLKYYGGEKSGDEIKEFQGSFYDSLWCIEPLIWTQMLGRLAINLWEEHGGANTVTHLVQIILLIPSFRPIVSGVFFSVPMYYALSNLFFAIPRLIPIYQCLQRYQNLPELPAKSMAMPVTIYKGIAKQMRESKLIKCFSWYLVVHNFYSSFPDIFTLLRQWQCSLLDSILESVASMLDQNSNTDTVHIDIVVMIGLMYLSYQVREYCRDEKNKSESEARPSSQKAQTSFWCKKDKEKPRGSSASSSYSNSY